MSEKITGNEPMIAIVTPGQTYGDGSYEPPSVKEGLTIRQHFATMAMQGILTKYSLNKPEDQKVVCQLSVELADALITELNK